MKLAIVIMIFLLIGGYVIVKAYNYDLENKDDRKGFLSHFFKWLKQVGINIKDITGMAVKQSWLPDTNLTNNTNNTGE
jgi:hypothetical protein